MDNRHKDRETLKSYFQKGMVPTEEQFAALIDSLHNINDDGYLTSSEDDGLILSPAGKGRGLASLYNRHPSSPDARPLWRISLKDDDSLVISNSRGEDVMSIGPDGSMTMTKGKDLGSEEDMEEKKAENAQDSVGIVKVRADGYWHDLPVETAAKRESEGCRIYRISACWHHPGSAKYGFCEAIASHSDGKRRRVTSRRKHWWGWSGKIKIRWQVHDRNLYLQIRSRRGRYGDEYISCRTETLWDM